MKGKLITLVGILCITSLIVSGANAKRPNAPGAKPQLIVFTGDLAGAQIVEGCCPNAGPMPEYRMTLGGDLPDGTYDGQLFINYYGNAQNRRYIVHFRSESLGAIEIIGGVIHEDRKNKITTVTFTNEECVWNSGEGILTYVSVNFILTRYR